MMNNELQTQQQNTNELTEASTQEIRLQLREDAEVLKLVDSIDVKDQIAIMNFGEKTAQEISSFSDRILSSMKMSSTEDTSRLMKELTKLMDKFDKKELEDPKTFIGKMLRGGEKFINKILEKYQTLGGEIDKIHQELRKFEQELVSASRTFDQMYEENFNYYVVLQKHIVAADLVLEQIQGSELKKLEEQAMSGNQMASMQLDALRQNIDTLEQRKYDLEMAAAVSFSSAPQIKLVQRTSSKLIGQIKSAFITTLPIFKQGIITAVQNKRNKLIADSMDALRDKTREMYKKNASNTVQQSIDVARMSGQTVVSLDDVEQVMSTMIDGMRQTKAIEDELRQSREQGSVKIMELMDNYKQAKKE